MSKRLLLLLLALSTLLIVATVQFKDDFLFAVGLTHSSKIEDNSVNEVAAANKKTNQQNQQSENQTFDESERYRYINDDEAGPPHVLADGKLIELEDGMDLSGKMIEGNITGYRKIYHNINFSKCRFKDVFIYGVAFINTTFEDAIFEGRNGLINIVGRNINFNNVNFLFINNPLLGNKNKKDYKLKLLRQSEVFVVYDATNEDLLSQTLPYKMKHLDSLRFMVYGVDNKHDYSDFWFVNMLMPYNPESCYRDSWFQNSSMSSLTNEQFLSTMNYKVRIFEGISFSNIDFVTYARPDSMNSHPSDNTLLENKELSNAVFFNCRFSSSMRGTDIKDSVFTNCIFSEGTNLTVEQIKSTWNYKNNRMDLIKLPPDLQKYFDEEKKEKE